MAAPVPPPPWIDLTALWQIVVLGIVAGAGLPALFAVGLRALSLPGRREPAPATGPVRAADGTVTTASDASSGRVIGGSTVGMVLGAVCFLIVLAAIGWGIDAIWVAGHPS